MVVQARAAPGEEPPERRRRPQALARRDDLREGEGTLIRFGGLGELVEYRHWQEDALDRRVADEAGERERVAAHRIVRDDEPAAEAQRREDLVKGEVEADRARLQGPAPTGLGPRSVVPEQKVDQRAVAHRDALRAPGRTRRVDHVREIACSRRRASGGGVVAEQRRVHRDDRGRPDARRKLAARRGEEGAHARVGDDVAHALVGIVSIDRDVCGTGAHHAEHRREQHGTGVHAQADEVTRADAGGAQPRRHPFCELCELGIRRRVAFVHDRHCLRLGVGLAREELVDSGGGEDYGATLCTRNGPIARKSIWVLANVLSASLGEQMIGSWSLKDVFSSIGTPVRSANAAISR